jgi:hypothetical protein
MGIGAKAARIFNQTLDDSEEIGLPQSLHPGRTEGCL